MIVELSLSKAGSPRLKITGSVRVFLGMDPIDLRKSVTGHFKVYHPRSNVSGTPSASGGRSRNVRQVSV